MEPLLALWALVPVGALAWLIHRGARWRTAGLVLARLMIAVVTFAAVASAVAQSMTTVCYNGPCTEHTAALYGALVLFVLVGVAVLLALVSVLVGRGVSRAPAERLRDHPGMGPRRLVCDVLALAALTAAAVVYGRALGHAALSEKAPIAPGDAFGLWLAAAAAFAVAGRVTPPWRSPV